MTDLIRQLSHTALVFTVVFILNVIPAFAPPTWLTLSVIGFSSPDIPVPWLFNGGLHDYDHPIPPRDTGGGRDDRIGCGNSDNTEGIVNRLMHIEHAKPGELRQLGYEAADTIKALRAGHDAPGEPDPIFAAIERHRQAAEKCDAISKEMHDDPRVAEAAEAEGTLDAAMDELIGDASIDLIEIQPTTTAGAAALLHYIANAKIWQSAMNRSLTPS
jgi:hypothetical protein